MLAKDLTPNPKAVNIVRPSTQRHNQHRNPPLTDSSFSSTSSPAYINLSSSTTSSTNTLSTASTNTTLQTLTTANSFSPPKISPMIRQPSMDSNPGLSFFCQLQSNTTTAPKQEYTTTVAKKSVISSSIYGPSHFRSSSASSASVDSDINNDTRGLQVENKKGPLVISRINLASFQQQQQQRVRAPPPPIDTTPLNKEETSFVKKTSQHHVTKNDDTIQREDQDVVDFDIDLDIDDDTDDNSHTAADTTTAKTTATLKPGFGFLTNSSGGVGSFLLRGNILAAQKPRADEARIFRKVKDLEIEKKSLLQLNQTLEMVVKEQSDRISDLQNRLAAIERPLTPALDTQSVCSSKDGLLFLSPVLETQTIPDFDQCVEEEDAAFERIRAIVANLIDQAQTAVSHDQRLSAHALMELDQQAEINRYFSSTGSSDVRKTATSKRRPRSMILPNKASTKGIAAASPPSNTSIRRVSIGSINSNSSSQHLLSTSPIPNRYYNSSTSNRRLSSASSTATASAKDTTTSHNQHTSIRSIASRSQHQHDSSQPKKWVN